MQLHIWSKEAIREMKCDEKIHMTKVNEMSHEKRRQLLHVMKYLMKSNAVVTKYEITAIVREHIVEPHIISVV